MPYSRTMLNVESHGPLLRVTLNRPEVRNAFDDELIAQLTAAFDHLGPETRVVVISGEGATFCAGGDLNWMRRAANYTVEENEADALSLAGLFQSIVDCPAVVIAQVQGAAFGGGCGLVAAADVAVAARDTKFSFSEVKLGLVPATISPFVLPKIGPGHARHLFTTGEVFDGEHALRIGLIHDAVDGDGLNAAVMKRVKSVLSAGPQAVAAAKQLAQGPRLSAEISARLLAETRAGDEAREGIAAFLDRRQASYVEEV